MTLWSHKILSREGPSTSQDVSSTSGLYLPNTSISPPGETTKKVSRQCQMSLGRRGVKSPQWRSTALSFAAKGTLMCIPHPCKKKHLVPEGSRDWPKSVLSVTNITASSIFVLVPLLALHRLVLPGTGVFTCTHLPYSTQRPATSPPNLFPFLQSQISPAQKALLDVPVCAQQRPHRGRQPGLTAEPSTPLASGRVGVASWSIPATLRTSTKPPRQLISPAAHRGHSVSSGCAPQPTSLPGRLGGCHRDRLCRCFSGRSFEAGQAPRVSEPSRPKVERACEVAGADASALSGRVIAEEEPQRPGEVG